MTLAMISTLTLSLLVGLALGLLGGGGSILTVPVLLYAAHVEPKPAIAMSLFVVAVAAASGLLQHARKGNVDWATGLVFGVSGMAGAYLGGRAAAHLPGSLLVLLFAGAMVAAGIAMLRRRDLDEAPPAARTAARDWVKIGLVGLVVSTFTGMVGAGGGFVIVPALAMIGGLSMTRAVGTSLLVITLSSTAGLAGHLAHTAVDGQLLALVTAAAVAGTVFGHRLGGRLSPRTLRRSFAVGVLALAVVLAGGELKKLDDLPSSSVELAR